MPNNTASANVLILLAAPQGTGIAEQEGPGWDSLVFSAAAAGRDCDGSGDDSPPEWTHLGRVQAAA